MKRLIEDAAKMDKSVDANSTSFANIVQAIHVVQENLDIAGTTAKEASDTISGSLASMKSAWGNLLPALINGGDSFDQCVNNLVSSTKTFIKNIKPAIISALSGIGKLIEELAPIIEKEFPKLVDELLPPLIKAATSLLKGLIKAIPNIVKAIIKEIPDILKGIGEAISEAFGAKFTFLEKFGNALKDNAGKIAKAVPVLVGAFVGFKALTTVIPAITGLFGKSSGGGGSGIFGGLADFAKTKPTVILKGIANLAIVLGGVTILAAAFSAVAPYIAKLSDFKSIVKLAGTMAILGVLGLALAKFGEIAGKMSVSSVAKGLANMAIMLAGVGVLTVAIAAVASLTKGLINVRDIMELSAMMLVIGALGTALSVFAGIVGLIPIPVVLAGLANIALVLVGITALVTVFGALNAIPGFNEFLKSGGELLSTVFGIIGEVAGSIVGGFGKGLSDALPAIGENLGKFGENITPLFDNIKGVDIGGVGLFFTSLVALLAIATGNEIVEGIKSFFGGGESALSKLGTQLADFGTNAKGFFDIISTYPESGFTNAAKLFECLAGINNLPSSGGIGSWFTGGINYEDIADGLYKLASNKVISFFNKVSTLQQIGFDNATKLFDCLAGMKGLPKSGGIGSWFTGGINYEDIANGLSQLSSAKVISFFNMVSGLDQISFDNATKLFDLLAGMKGLPKSGGIGSWFTGDVSYANIAKGLGELSGKGVKNFFGMVTNITQAGFDNAIKLFDTLSGMGKLTSGESFWERLKDGLFGGNDNKTQLSIIADGLAGFVSKAKPFFEQINALNLGNLNGLWDSLVKGGKVTDGISTVIDEKISEIVEKITDLPKQMGSGLKKGGKSLGEALVDVWTDAVKSSVKPVNKVLEAANWILKEFGSKKRVLSWQPYAKGTGGHKGGNALVNDGRGAELVQMPNGRTFIPNGRNVFLPNAPKGMKVLPAEQTARLMGKNKPTYNYANGIGDIDLWSYVDDASGLARKIADSVSYKGMNGYVLDVGKSMVSTFTGEMSGWINEVFDEAGAKSLADYVASGGVKQWRATVVRALKMEGQYSAANVKRTLFQMQTESGGNPRAINLWDSNAKNGTPSKGLMQVIDPTFRTYARSGYDKNIYDPLSNILASVRYATSRYGSLSKAYNGVGYSNGVGELSLPSRSTKVTYTPESDYSSYSKTKVEHNTYAPTFNLTIEGTGDDRAMARKVKKWIQEALDETFESMERKTTRLQEV